MWLGLLLPQLFLSRSWCHRMALTVSEMRADLIRILCGQLFESQKMSFASKRPCEHLSLNKHRRPTYQLGP